MTSAFVKFNDWKGVIAAHAATLKVVIAARAEALGERGRTLIQNIKMMDRRTVLLNAGFGVLLLIGISIIAYVSLRHVTGQAQQPATAPAAQQVAGQEEPMPVVEPTILMPTDPDSARKINAAVAFSTAPNPAAAPYKSVEIGDDLERSVACLATAMIFEAGDDAEGERSVGQVVLNRVHHPAFPNTVCGVVFQGSERKTGCQFSFTCDGSMTRRSPRPEVWLRAQELAKQALNGAVFAQVGTATHYHTDWVVPYWSSSLDKITAVKTHLFFRWKGWWGTPPAFRQVPAIEAPIVPALADFSDVHKTPETLAALRMAKALETMAIRREGNAFLIGWDADASLEILPQLASTLCGPSPDCFVIGWPGGMKALPEIGKHHAALMRASFLYQPGIGVAPGRALWNCKALKRPGLECLTPRDLAAVKIVPTVDLALLPPMTSLIDSLPTPEPMPVESEASTPAPEVAEAKPVAAPTPVERVLMPTRKRRDPCAAMRGVAAADRIGPCK
ncbi:MAG: cell wall hydrolase [Pseudomonadota bacterium]